MANDGETCGKSIGSIVMQRRANWLRAAWRRRPAAKAIIKSDGRQFGIHWLGIN